MEIRPSSGQSAADSAAVLGAAVSLREACLAVAGREHGINLSECYNGGDQWMREVMRIAVEFEEWACAHVAFEMLDEVWPYFLEERFGTACLEAVGVECLGGFDEADCLRVALRLRLPIAHDGTLPIPVLVEAQNPVARAGFARFRIQSMRNSVEEDDNALPFGWDDDPYDECFGPVYFALYGIADDGLHEHIADRETFAAVQALAERLNPGITFPACPRSSPRPSARR